MLEKDTNTPQKQKVLHKEKRKTKGEGMMYVAPNLDFLVAEMQWLSSLVNHRYDELMNNKEAQAFDAIATAPELDESPYSIYIQENNLSNLDRVILALAVASEYDQSVFKMLVALKRSKGVLGLEVGGNLDEKKGVFKPTFLTALFLLSGNNKQWLAQYTSTLFHYNTLLREQLIYVESTAHLTHEVIQLDNAYLHYFLTGEKPRLDYGKYFPAQLFTTTTTLDDIILNERIKESLTPIGNYVSSMNGDFYTEVNHKFKKGFMVMLYGPPGTGKTLLAGALANTYGIDMYRVDLSQVVSKYIGETEKNLELLFDRLEGKNCMLFFDEADALFGKRADVQDAQDRFANQEVSYLLQRIENFDGLTVLATNFENNLDDAFKRRINVMINVHRPQEAECELLWKHYLPEGFTFSSDNLLTYLTKEYRYTGANIKNVMEMLCLDLYKDQTTEVTFERLKPYLLIENIKAFGMNKSRVSDPGRYGI